MKLSKCYKVKNLRLIQEGYILEKNYLYINVSAQKIINLIRIFINQLDEPGFFFLELPLTQDEEMKLEKKDKNGFHNNVYYIDGLKRKQLEVIMNDSGEILINGGLSKFGFASHITKDEICIDRYNIVIIYTSNFQRYESLLNSINITKKTDLLVAWDLFSDKNPGHSKMLKVNGEDVYALVDKYQDWGIYKAEIR